MSSCDVILRRASFCLAVSVASAAALLIPAAGTRAAECGTGVELRLSAPDSSQGGLLLAEVRSTAPLEELAGKWGEREVPFWKEVGKEQGAGREDVRRALIGVDLEKPAGKYPFTVAGRTQSGSTVGCGATIDVSEGHFATESLTVKKQFVEPDPQQIARAEAEAKRLREIYDHVTPERLWSGNFRAPLDGEFKGSNFGKRRVLNGHPGSPHGGTDFPAPAGTPVYAAQAGRVVLAEELFFAGNTVVVDHGLGVYTFYCHFSEIDAKVGQLVEAGALLGKVGATGRVTGPHLHWGLTVERSRVNALEIVKLLGNGAKQAE